MTLVVLAATLSMCDGNLGSIFPSDVVKPTLGLLNVLCKPSLLFLVIDGPMLFIVHHIPKAAIRDATCSTIQRIAIC
jgi:hypothetical protein